MIGWLQLTDAQRRTSIEQAFAISGIAEKAIEKDWWVTLTLKALFGTLYAKHLIFKGGTSLSKGWKLIERFSEDIDIALEPEAFGREYKKDPSHTYVKTLKKEGCAFTSNVMKDAIIKQFAALGIPEGTLAIAAAEVPETIPDRDPQTIFVKYKSLYPPHPYLADEVKIEFSVRSLKEPFASVSIQSILSEVFPNKLYEETPFEVTAVDPKKTLLEKAFLLHEKFITTTAEKMQGERQSRHLYDLLKMMNTPPGKAALTDTAFYSTLLEHRKNYIRLSGVDYDSLHYSRLSFVPTALFIEMFRKDYEAMQTAMIYGPSPGFDEMLDQLKLLNGRFRVMDESRSLEQIIDNAVQNAKAADSATPEGSTVEVAAVYESDPYIAEGRNNEPVTYMVQFIRQKGAFIFQNISIHK